MSAMIDDDEALALVVEVEDLTALVARIPEIANATVAEQASGYRARVKAVIGEIAARRGPDKKAKHEVWKAAVAAEKEELEAPEALLEVLNTRLGTYEAAQRRAQAIAEARAAEEAKRLEAARAPAAPGEVRMPVVVPTAPVETKIAGLGFISVFDVVVSDPVAFALAVVQGALPPTVIAGVLPVLRDLAKTLAKNQAAGTPVVIPGCTVTEKRSPRG